MTAKTWYYENKTCHKAQLWNKIWSKTKEFSNELLEFPVWIVSVQNLSVTQSLYWLMQNTSWAVTKSKSQSIYDPIWSQISNVPAHYLSDVSKFKYPFPFGAGEMVIQTHSLLVQNKLRCELRLVCKVCAHTPSKINTKVVYILVYKGQRNFCLWCCIYCRLCNWPVTAVTATTVLHVMKITSNSTHLMLHLLKIHLHPSSPQHVYLDNHSKFFTSFPKDCS